jgi:aspartyl-tRNA(Asn)/glutamyl-tRNA(Gln) amidotransferase subunit A
MENNCELTIEKLAPQIARKKISPVELTRFLLDRISKLQPTINAYITITAEMALRQARKAEREIMRGEYRGALHGIPVSIKDLFYTEGIRTTAGSKILRSFIPDRNAVAVDRLLRAGCIVLGKTNLHEFAFGPTNINPHYGPARNPWDQTRISGGSSGGSAASVMTAQAIASLGTDTGGSIRIPAAACGCVGLKPTKGVIPTDGVIPLSFTLDHIGPLSRSVGDAAILFSILSQSENRKSGAGSFRANLRKGVRSLRIGMPRQYFFDLIQPEIRKAVLAAASAYESMGAKVVEIDLPPEIKETGRLAAEITGVEAFAYHEQWLRKKPLEYGADVRDRLMGSQNSAASSYIHAMQELQTYQQQLDQALETTDLLIAPTIPMDAPALDQKEVIFGKIHEDVRTALLRLTRPGNLSGLPSISLPCGFSSRNLPIGLQLIGRRHGEAALLRAAYAYEAATSWHQQFPPDKKLMSQLIPNISGNDV